MTTPPPIMWMKPNATALLLPNSPTTMEAAKASRDANLAILMGAPNVVRGKSHSGNISATDLAAQGLLDVLSSDYVPFSLMHSAFKLAKNVEQIQLPEAIAKVSLNPARAAGLDDRGELAVGKKLISPAYICLKMACRLCAPCGAMANA